jgi:hypothetical protein
VHLFLKTSAPLLETQRTAAKCKKISENVAENFCYQNPREGAEGGELS